MCLAFQNVFNLFFIDHCFWVTWNLIFETIFNLQWNCVAFPCNLFLKCATPSRISRWDPGQGIVHSVSQPQLPKAFKHTLQPISSSTSLSRNLSSYIMSIMFLFCWISANWVFTCKDRASSAVQLFSATLCMSSVSICVS